MTPRPGMVWSPRILQWVPEGKVWDARLRKWIDDPDVLAPARLAAGADGAPVDGARSAVEEPASAPWRGPRKCPQRSRRKRIGHGPKATLPRRNGEPVPRRGRRVRWSFPRKSIIDKGAE